MAKSQSDVAILRYVLAAEVEAPAKPDDPKLPPSVQQFLRRANRRQLTQLLIQVLERLHHQQSGQTKKKRKRKSP